MKWASWLCTGLCAAMLIFSGAMKLVGGPDLAKGFEHLGLAADQRFLLAVFELGSVLLYLFPRTTYLGAILITGYMGGAMFAHLRIGEPYFIQFLLGVLAWGGLYLRDPRLGDLIPLRK